MKQLRPLTVSVKRKLLIRFGLALFLVTFFGLFSIRFYMDRATAYDRLLMMENTRNPKAFSIEQLNFIAGHINSIESRMLNELIISNAAVIIIFTFFSYLLARGLFESLTDSLEREKRFLDDASHELRTPLAAITTITETTLRSPKNTAADYTTALAEVLDESKRLSATLNDFLFLSKTDDQRVKLKMEELDLGETLNKISKTMQTVANSKSIKIETIVPHKKATVKADENKIKQLLTILVDNAIKYSNNNSKIIIRLDVRSKIKVAVQDFGHGISPKDLPHIFERFYRSDSARTDLGHGLGLSIAEWIADAHNIKIDVKSSLHSGSTFTLTF